jgi:hypothetical protein
MNRASSLLSSLFVLSCVLVTGLQVKGQPQPTPERSRTIKAARTLFPINDDTAFIDLSGKVVINSAQPDLQRDLRLVSTMLGGFRSESPTIGARFGEFSEGLAVVGWALCPRCRNPSYVNGLIDETGRLVIPPRRFEARYGAFHEGLAQYSDQGWGFIDREGRVVIRAQFYAASDFSEGLASVRTEAGKFGYINRTGELVIPYQFDWVSDFHDGLAAIKLRGKYCFIDKTGKVVLQSSDWRETTTFSEGLAAVRIQITDNSVYQGYQDEKCGYIDRAGKIVISPRFDQVGEFSEGRALFFHTGQQAGYGFLDRKGQIVIDARFLAGKSFSEGLAAVAVKSSDGKKLWGYIDREGKWVIEPRFQNANSFDGGLAGVDCNSYGADCQAYIDTAGNIRWQSTEHSAER